MDKIQFKVENFEGPLDVLLYLISKHKLNIYDIPISQLLEQYLSYMDQRKFADLEISSEFLEMAARLVYIKTVMLLPKSEEAEDMRRELTGELIEYSICKLAAERLGQQYVGNLLFVRQPQEVEYDETYRRRHQMSELFDAYLNTTLRIKRRLPPKAEEFNEIVERPIVSVTAKIISILRRLVKGPLEYDRIFERSGSRPELVATFLALLELVRAGRVKVDDTRVTVVKNTAREDN